MAIGDQNYYVNFMDAEDNDIGSYRLRATNLNDAFREVASKPLPNAACEMFIADGCADPFPWWISDDND